jgi:hypothetical protein
LYWGRRALAAFAVTRPDVTEHLQLSPISTEPLGAGNGAAGPPVSRIREIVSPNAHYADGERVEGQP